MEANSPSTTETKSTRHRNTDAKRAFRSVHKTEWPLFQYSVFNENSIGVHMNRHCLEDDKTLHYTALPLTMTFLTSDLANTSSEESNLQLKFGWSHQCWFTTDRHVTASGRSEVDHGRMQNWLLFKTQAAPNYGLFTTQVLSSVIIRFKLKQWSYNTCPVVSVVQPEPLLCGVSDVKVIHCMKLWERTKIGLSRTELRVAIYNMWGICVISCQLLWSHLLKHSCDTGLTLNESGPRTLLQGRLLGISKKIELRSMLCVAHKSKDDERLLV